VKNEDESDEEEVTNLDYELTDEATIRLAVQALMEVRAG
jgi:hypothetical protein